MRKLPNTVETKVYVPNTLRNCFTFDNFFAWEHFYIGFLLFNKHFKHQGQVCTSGPYWNCFFSGKRLFKNNYQNASSRIVTILWSFYLCCKLSNVVNLSNRCRCLILLKSSQCERYLINICSIYSFDVLYF